MVQRLTESFYSHISSKRKKCNKKQMQGVLTTAGLTTVFQSHLLVNSETSAEGKKRPNMEYMPAFLPSHCDHCYQGISGPTKDLYNPEALLLSSFQKCAANLHSSCSPQQLDQNTGIYHSISTALC